MDYSELKKLQKIELNIMQTVDAFCQKYNIRYSLYAGTALGAVRHSGFIPWDDDIDIAMERKEFNRFCQLWKKRSVQGYTLSCLQYDKDCATCHAKVHKDGTILLSDGEVEEVGNHGIWVDIFPLDRVGNRNNQKKVFRKAKELIILSRANTKSFNDSFSKKLVRGLIRSIPQKYRRRRILTLLRWLATNDELLKNENYSYVSLSATYAFKYRFSNSLTKKTVQIRFQDVEFDIWEDYDHMLTEIYGDYMQLPPESERVCKHNPVKISFGDGIE